MENNVDKSFKRAKFYHNLSVYVPLILLILPTIMYTVVMNRLYEMDESCGAPLKTASAVIIVISVFVAALLFFFNYKQYSFAKIFSGISKSRVVFEDTISSIVGIAVIDYAYISSALGFFSWVTDPDRRGHLGPHIFFPYVVCLLFLIPVLLPELFSFDKIRKDYKAAAIDNTGEQFQNPESDNDKR